MTFGKGPYDHSFTCDIVAHVPQGVVLKGSAGAALAPLAFEQAADRIEKQLRRYKRRLKDRHAQAATPRRRSRPATPCSRRRPKRRSRSTIRRWSPKPGSTFRVASVSDAVMLLDLRNTNALMFRNSGTGAFNMVYRRGDGTIGWVEPRATGRNALPLTRFSPLEEATSFHPVP